MIGSILGDIAGSVYEFHNIKTKEFPFLTPQKGYTDDSILTLATADWLLHGGDCATYYFRYATRYPCPLGGFGGRFREWLRQGQQTGQLRPYGSCGNGSAMRVGPVGWAFRTEEETLEAARISAACTHNHPEGIKGAQATALCIFLGRNGKSKEDIKNTVEAKFGYDLNFTCDGIRDTYQWNATCQGTVPQAIRAFLTGRTLRTAYVRLSHWVATVTHWPASRAALQKHSTAFPLPYMLRPCTTCRRISSR